jgi:uncharacterized membrane protein
MSVESSKMLGGISACFILLGIISSIIAIIQFALPQTVALNLVLTATTLVVGLLVFVGFILFFIAMHGFSQAYGEHKIFDYPLYGFIIAIVASVVAFAALLLYAFLNLAGTLSSYNLSSATPSPTLTSSQIIPYIVPFIAVFGVITLVNVLFDFWAFNLLGEKSHVPLFRTGAKVMLAGAALIVIVGIFALAVSPSLLSFSTLYLITLPGGIVQDIAWALLAVAFFRIKPLAQSNVTRDSSAVQGQPV